MDIKAFSKLLGSVEMRRVKDHTSKLPLSPVSDTGLCGH